MQVVNSNYANNNRYNQPFAGIRKVEFEGLYKKYPELGKELVDTFKNNSKVMEFCKKYDVDVIFHAMKQGIDRVESAVCVFYDNVAKSKFKKILFGRSDDKVVIHGWGNNYNLDGSLKEATANLKAAISPEVLKSERPTGLLEAHLESADNKMQEMLVEKAKAKQAKFAQVELNKQVKAAKNEAKAELDDSIQDLINKSS